MKQESVYGLVCTGGGAHGAYQVGVLKFIHEHYSRGEASPFRIFAGASCGALNTTFYASKSAMARKAGLELEDFWLHFDVPRYHGNLLQNVLVAAYRRWRKKLTGQSTWAVLDPKPMQDAIGRGFSRKSLDDCLKSGSTLGVAIAATELLSGRACWFQEGPRAKTWNLFHSLGVLDQLQNPHLEASCSVPLFLPPVKIGERYFLDGSISLNRPLSAALNMGATRLLVVATDKPIPRSLPVYRPLFRPRFMDTVRMLLDRMSHDSAFDEAIEIDMLNRFYEALSQKNKHAEGELESLPLYHEEALPSHYQPTEICMIFPSKRIRAASLVDEKDLMPGPHHKRTRFMFNEKFIRNLIHLGYEDAKSRQDELHKFFAVQEPSARRWFLFRRRRPSPEAA